MLKIINYRIAMQCNGFDRMGGGERLQLLLQTGTGNTGATWQPQS